MLILRTDPEFNDMAKGDMYQYINAIRIESANVAEGEAQPPENQNLRDATNISIYNKYIETEIDPSYSTIKEALAKKHYTENECWINSLLDHYPRPYDTQARLTFQNPDPTTYARTSTHNRRRV